MRPPADYDGKIDPVIRITLKKTSDTYVAVHLIGDDEMMGILPMDLFYQRDAQRLRDRLSDGEEVTFRLVEE